MVRGCAEQNPPLPAIVSDARALGFASEAFYCRLPLRQPELHPGDRRPTAALAESRRVLKTGGLLVFDLIPFERCRRACSRSATWTGPDPLHYDWQAHWDAKTHLCRVDMWFAYKDDEGVTFTETHFSAATHRTKSPRR